MHGSSDCDALCRLMRRGGGLAEHRCGMFRPNLESACSPTGAAPAALRAPF